MRTKYPFQGSSHILSTYLHKVWTGFTTDGALQQKKKTAIFFPRGTLNCVCVRRFLMSHSSIIHYHIYGPVSQLVQINGANRKHERKLQKGKKINQLTAHSISRGEWVIFTVLMVHCALLSYISYTHYKYTIKIWSIDSLESQLDSLNMICFPLLRQSCSKFSKVLGVYFHSRLDRTETDSWNTTEQTQELWIVLWTFTCKFMLASGMIQSSIWCLLLWPQAVAVVLKLSIAAQQGIKGKTPCVCV